MAPTAHGSATKSFEITYMNIEEIIKERHSVRTFASDDPVSEQQIDALRQSIATASAPFGGDFTIKLEQFHLKGPQRPGTYGAISGAEWYLLMGIADGTPSSLSAGFAMEQVVLKATELGLGTCWMALTFKSSDFTDRAAMPPSTPLRIVLPVGHPAPRRRVIESLTRMSLGSSKRLPMEKLFSEGRFDTPVSESNQFYEALSMMRLAPSAKNTQPWRALVDGSTVWFYYVDKTAVSALDLGIGLCHFSLLLKAKGLIGVWGDATDAPQRNRYIPAVKFSL